MSAWSSDVCSSDLLVLREARDVGVEPWDQCRAGLGGGRRRGLNGHKTRTVGGEHDVFEPHLKRTGKAPAGIRAHFDIAILNVVERPFAHTKIGSASCRERVCTYV